MQYSNLKRELTSKGITIEELADLLKLHRNTVKNKLNGISSFSIEEAEKIQSIIFPQFTMRYLFNREVKEGA